MKIEHAITIGDLRLLARNYLPSFVFDNLEGGAGDSLTSARNIEALDRVRLWPRVLNDVTEVDQKTELFGKLYNSPFGISATGLGPVMRQGCELFLAEAARMANIPFLLSSMSGPSIEEIAKIAPENVWFQIYGVKDRQITENLVLRARDAGVPVLVMTVDWPASIKSERVLRTGITVPMKITPRVLPLVISQTLKHPNWTIDYLRHGGFPVLKNYAPYATPGSDAHQIIAQHSAGFPASQTWSDVETIRRLWPGKLILKGILHPGDARRAIDVGADAVTVSNHGGKTGERMVPAIDVLPLVKEAVTDRIPVLFDSGIRRGAHIVAARCLGAQFAFIGRASLYGVIAGKRAGATRAIEILRKEIEQALRALGSGRYDDLGPHNLFGNSVPHAEKERHHFLMDK